jgi:hypothetical protein
MRLLHKRLYQTAYVLRYTDNIILLTNLQIASKLFGEAARILPTVTGFLCVHAYMYSPHLPADHEHST